MYKLILWPCKDMPPCATNADQLEKLLPLLEGKRVSLVVNHTSLCGKTHLLDTLVSLVKIVRVFAPEHGFRGDADAGEYIQNGKDTRTRVPILSLYGKKTRNRYRHS